MKGLLLKDFYVIKSSIVTMLITFLTVGIGISFFVVPQALIILSTILSGMTAVMILNSDKKSGWLKTSVTFPVKKHFIISCKYVFYMLSCTVGVVFGLIFSTVIAFIINDMNFSFLPIFLVVAISMALFSGGILIPCFYMLSEEKSVIVSMLVYPINFGFIFIIRKLIINDILSNMVVIIGSFIVFVLSWRLICKYVKKKDI